MNIFSYDKTTIDKIIILILCVLLPSCKIQQDHDALLVEALTEKAKQGNSIAQLDLGVMYYHGEGVEQDYAHALKWYRLAVKQGNSTAQVNLGVMYDQGEGVEQDYAHALKWYRLAAKKGSSIAQNNLGVMYKKGEGVEQDYAHALKWFGLAAKQGDSTAQVNLGVMYYKGEGVEKNINYAYMWIFIANKEQAKYAEQLHELNNKMTPEDLVKATMLVENCVRSKYQKCG